MSGLVEPRLQERVVRAMDALRDGKSGDAYDVLHVGLHEALGSDRCRFCMVVKAGPKPSTQRVYPWYSRDLSWSQRNALGTIVQSGPMRGVLLHKSTKDALLLRGLLRLEGAWLHVTERGQEVWENKVQPIPMADRRQCSHCDFIVDGRVAEDLAHLRTHEARHAARTR